MADDEDSASGADQKQTAEWKPRFRFESVTLPKPTGFFPDLSQAIITPIQDGDLYDLRITSTDGDTFKYPQYYWSEEYAVEHGVTEKKSHELAQSVGIKEDLLLRIVMTIAVDKAKKPIFRGCEVNWRDDRKPGRTAGGIPIIWGGVTYKESSENYRLLFRSDELSAKLEQILREQISRATARPGKGSRHAARQPAVRQLLEALESYGRLMRSCSVKELKYPPNNPGRFQERAALAVLIPFWPRMTGKQPEDDKSNLYRIFTEVCALAGIVNLSSRQSFYNWLREELIERDDARKSDADGD